MRPAKFSPVKTSLIVLFFTSIFMLSCSDECETSQQFMMYEPIFETMESFRDDVTVSSAREIESPGKIYFKDGFLLINEPGKGIHVIDNRDLRAPIPLRFLEIPGNFDLAAQGNYLYADSYLDLLIFDITDLNNVVLVNRQEDVFLTSYLYNGLYTEDLGLITGYTEELVKTTTNTDCQPDFMGCPNCMFIDLAVAEAGMADLRTANTQSGTTGIGGSMARFTITQDHLYTLDPQTLRTFDLTELSAPEMIHETSVGWGMETIFPNDDFLYLGAQNGMHIYSIANPSTPNFVSTYQHINACDPVVVQGDYAYVTLRSGNACSGFSNQLDVVDISNKANPRLIQSFEMQNPHGLGIDGTCLFICEGEFGLKLFDASDVTGIGDNMIRHYKGMHALDVIPLNNNLMMIGNDGLHQYGYNCSGEDLLLMSTISFGAE